MNPIVVRDRGCASVAVIVTKSLARAQEHAEHSHAATSYSDSARYLCATGCKTAPGIFGLPK